MKLSLLSILPLLSAVLTSPLPEPVAAPAAILPRETALNAFLTILLDFLPAIDGTINAVTGVLTTFEQLLATLTGQQTTYNQLSVACRTYTVIFARGTTEPGNVGILVGPPFFEALKESVGTSAVAIQGVNGYAASVAGYLAGGDATGSANM